MLLGFCYHYSETNRNLPSVMQKPNHTSTRISNDTSSPAYVSDDICNPARVSNDISGPIKLWHVSPIKLRHVSLTHPQTTINRSLPKAVKESWGEILKGPRSWEETKIEKSRSSVGTKLWILQELQLWIRREIIQIIFLDFKGHWNQTSKPSKTSTNHKLVKLYGFKPLKPRRTSATNLQIRRTFEAKSSKLPA